MNNIVDKLVGLPYVWGSLDPETYGGVNCVGLVVYAQRLVGRACPMTAAELAYFGQPVPAGKHAVGDLIVIKASERWAAEGRPWHFGLVVDAETMVHASSKRGVELKPIPWHREMHVNRIGW